MRLLHVVPSYLPAVRYGGPIKSVHALCSALALRGHDVHVFTTNVDGAGHSQVPLGRPVECDGVKVWYFPSRLRRLYWSPLMARALKENTRQFDLVHLHSIFLWPTSAAARAARAAGVPYVLSPRGMLVKELFRARSRYAKIAWMAMFERANLAHAAGIHVTSRVEAAALQEFACRLAGRILLVPNGVHTAQEIASADHPHPPYLLMLGRINWKKRIDIALQTVALVDGLRLVIAGGDDENLAADLRRAAVELGVDGRVDFIGPVDDVQKSKLLREALALLMPSISENFGNSAMESMAEGTPAIVTPEVGVAEIIEASGAGFVVASNPAAFADAVRQLQRDPELRAQMGEKARMAVAADYSWSAIAARMESEYSALLIQERRQR
jgi:glycosyltransferase involved in cell wall biosynthesis